MIKLDKLRRLRDERTIEATAILTGVKCAGRTHLTTDETTRFRNAKAAITDLNEQIEDLEAEERWHANMSPELKAEHRATTRGSTSWAERAANAIAAATGESRAITSGSITVPTLVDPAITPKSRPSRLTDLLVSRSALSSNGFEYLRQTVRSNAAAPVADHATKPTSTFTLTPVIDRARVLAHLSEPFPIRYFLDHADVVRWLEVEMQEGVLSALESQVIGGSGSGENLTGILNTAGITEVEFATDAPTTIRKSITALQNIGVTPNAIALNPGDAENLDLLKEGAGGIGFLLDGFQHGTAGSANVFGDDTSIHRIVSPSVPAGTAILADWSAVRLYIREGMRLDIDAGGTHFEKNEAVMRAEIRIGLGHLHPASFAVAELSA